ncbi:MAG: hypothetical protein K0B01_05215 [Syntrophobacterales bacterium]|nr:hypothetical protein [Syntrophobacterales bacterium]
MTLLQQIEGHWTNQADGIAAKWAKKLKDNENTVRESAKKFHEWHPLHVYLSVTRAMNASISFSLRYQGQEVGSLSVNGDDVHLVISSKTAENNKEYFGIINKPGKFLWRGKDAAEFRKQFKNLNRLNGKGRVPEHRVESEFLKQMADHTSGKFAGTLKNIQPVLWAGCPFQFPLPISGNTGVPKPGKGNIDILARRRSGKETRISIWELKKPGTTAHAIEQAYIYSVTLIKMLRSKPWGDFWYKNIIGFKGKVPDRLSIESVVAVSIKSERQRSAFTSKLQKFKADNSLQVGKEKDTIKLYVAYYQEGPPMVIDMKEI